jgi:membrane-bound lytic murein transglycosylase D
VVSDLFLAEGRLKNLLGTKRRMRACLRILTATGCLCLLALAFSHAQARAETEPFTRPPSLEPQIKFWVDVFTGYSYRDFVLLDRDDADKIYQVYHLPGDGCPSRDEIDWANTYLKSKYADILMRLASGREPMGTDERHVAEMFKGRSPYALRLAADNLRVQEGLKERFREGLLRSKYYRPTMEKIFKTAGLPVELVTLAQVESGFERGARSSAGAVGIWQFTRATGKHYMTIRGRHDDRLNPSRETEAAAKLLRSNYETLGDWPLAITAYNYGTAGTARAAEQSGSDYAKMVKTYNGPHFGFAVKNYYAEFLAAMQVHKYEGKYFPGIESEPAIVPPPMPVHSAQLLQVSAPTGHHSKHHHSKKRSRTAVVRHSTQSS